MKKYIALFLVFSLMALSGDLYAKERRGADLIIQKIDDQQIRGELIAVKKNSLLLKVSESGVDTNIDISNIKVITIVGKSQKKKGLLLGLLVGGSSGAILGGLRIYPSGNVSSLKSATYYGIIFGLVGAVIGVAIGPKAEEAETIKIEGMSSIGPSFPKCIRKQAMKPNNALELMVLALLTHRSSAR